MEEKDLIDMVWNMEVSIKCKCGFETSLSSLKNNVEVIALHLCKSFN